MRISRAQANPILRKSFREYTGRKINLEFVESHVLFSTNWDGGTVNYYHILVDKPKFKYSKRLVVPAPWCNELEGKEIQIGRETMLIARAWFQGFDMGVTIYANPCWQYIYTLNQIVIVDQGGF